MTQSINFYFTHSNNKTDEPKKIFSFFLNSFPLSFEKEPNDNFLLPHNLCQGFEILWDWFNASI